MQRIFRVLVVMVGAVCLGNVGDASADVTEAGSFSSSLAVEAPPFHGIEPQVVLSHDSANGNGPVGIGWRLEAASYIAAAGRHGGAPRPDATNRFLVDGSELVPCSPVCRSGGSHESRRRDFVRTSFDGTSWTRLRPDGTRFHYDLLPLSGGDRWALSRVVDTHGNTVRYRHSCDGSDCRLDLISYADARTKCDPQDEQCLAGAVGARVIFHYEPRPDPSSYGTGGALAVTSKRLKTVEVRMAGELVRAYALEYETSRSTGSSLLRSVQRFPNDATVSLQGTVSRGATPPQPRTVFGTASMAGSGGAWSTGRVPLGGRLSMASPGPGDPSYPPVFGSSTAPNPAGIDWEEDGRLPYGLVQGDFDRDARTDYAGWAMTTACHVSFNAVLADSAAAGAVASGGGLSAGCSLVPQSIASAHVADLDGDGCDDILLMTRTGAVLPAMSRCNGTFALAEDPTPTGFGARPECAVGDVDADGRDDLACAYGDRDAHVGTARALAGGGFAVTRRPLSGIADTEQIRVTLGDVDGDGESDLMIAAAPSSGCPGTCSTWRLKTGIADGAGGFGPLWTGAETNVQWLSSGTVQEVELASADFDNDGRADFALVSAGSASNTTKVKVATSPKGLGPGFLPWPAVELAGTDVVVGDRNRDGRADLVTAGPELTPDGALVPGRIGEALATENDGFTAWAPTGEESCHAVEHSTGAEVNGDGILDVLCISEDDAEVFQVSDRVSPNRPPNGLGAISADVTGDGREDLVQVHFRNPGYEVHTLTAQASGGYTSSSATIAPDADMPLASPNTAAWMAMDVGGPGGRADGRADLVRVDRGGHLTRVSTLISTGTGWTPVVDTIPFSDADSGRWRPAKLDHDGRGDLVRVLEGHPGVRVEQLRANGSGWWIADEHTHFATSPPELADFHSIDVDGDTLTDLVRVEPGAIRTLVANADGGYAERAEEITTPVTAAEARATKPADLNGDGLQDLALVRAVDGCLRVSGHLSTGTTWVPYEAPAPDRPSCRSAAGVDDTRNLRVGDFDHDNRADIAHLSSHQSTPGKRRTAVHLLLNRGDQAWKVVDEPALALTHPDTWAYVAMDTDHDGRTELVHPGHDLDTLRWATPSDRLISTDNGRGAGARVEYRPLAGRRDYLPSGSLPTVVESITTTDAAHSPAVAETTTWDYDGARWSDQQHHLLGFHRVTASRDGTVRRYGTVLETVNDVTDACGARPASISSRSTSGRVYKTTGYEFVSPGAGKPFTCLVRVITEREQERGYEDLFKVTTLEHDVHGNVVSATESGSGAGTRRTTMDFRPNTTDHVVDRPARQRVQHQQDGAWHVDSSTEYRYDANTTWDAPPGALGELRLRRAWNDRTGGFAETRYEHDASGNVEKTINPVGVVETTVYDPDRELFPVRTCSALGCTEQVWDNALAAPTSVTDLNGNTTTYDHDAFGRRTRVTRPDGSSTSTVVLDDGGWTGAASQRRRIRTEVSDGSDGDGVLWREQLLDGLGRVYMTVREGDGGGRIVSDTRFSDASDRPAATSDPHLATSSPQWTSHRYDDAGRPIATELADGTTTQIEYHVARTTTHDPAGRSKTTVRDGFGRTIRVRDAGGTTSYVFDALDRRERLTDADGNVTQTAWDSLSRKRYETDPDRGTRAYTWRDDGTPDTETDASGQVIEWDYDSLGRPTARSERGADRAVARKIEWSWDADPATGETHGDSVGRVVRAEHSSDEVSGATDSWYDDAGRVSRSRRCADQECAELGFTFDAAGRLDVLTYPDAQGELGPDSELLTHRYDSAGRLASVTGLDPTARVPSVSYAKLHHTPLGQLETLEHGNGTVDRRAYDPTRHWLDRLQVRGPGGGIPHDVEYAHDADGNIHGITEAQPTALQQTFTYDDLERLTEVDASDPSRDRTYTYDAIGRMTSSSEAGTYAYDDPAHVHAATSTDRGHSRSYDANGNLTAMLDPSGRDLTIDWTVGGFPKRIVNNPTGAETIIGYDADDQRVVKHDDLGTTYILGRYVDKDPSGRFVKHYWADDRLVARRDGAGDLTDVHQDHLGSTRLTTDRAGQVRDRFEYDPYGKLLGSSGPSQHERGWHGGRRDHDSGLTYMNARYYDSELARFISPDSIVPDPYRPQSLDRYAYVEGRPMNHTDPTGHMKRQVEMRKEQAAESSFGYMYARALSGDCYVISFCREEVAPAATPGTARCRSCKKSEPSEWAQWPGEQISPPPLVEATGDPGEWTAWPGESISDPPLIAARTRRTRIEIEFTDDDSPPIVAPPVVTPTPLEEKRNELTDVKQRIGVLQTKMKATEREAKSNILGALPIVGGGAAAIYDLATGDALGTADNLAQDGLETAAEKLGMPKGWMAPIDAAQLHKSMNEHGANAAKMEALKQREYHLMDQLKDPAARHDLPGNWYLGPGDRTYDKRTGKPLDRIQGTR